MTYDQAYEAVRDLCSPHSIRNIKTANKEIRKYFGDYLIGMKQYADEFETTMNYHIWCDDQPEDDHIVTISYDFWNRRIS